MSDPLDPVNTDPYPVNPQMPASAQVPPVSGQGYVPDAVPPSVFGTKIPSTVVLSIGLLLFLMPFLEIRCNGMALGKFSGVQLATGFKIDIPGSDNTLTGKLQEAANKTGGQHHDGNPYALAALILSALAVVLAFTSSKTGVTAAGIVAVLAALALIALMINVNSQLEGEVTSGDDVLISIAFTPWFYISIIAALVGSFFCFKRLGSLKT